MKKIFSIFLLYQIVQINGLVLKSLPCQIDNTSITTDILNFFKANDLMNCLKECRENCSFAQFNFENNLCFLIQNGNGPLFSFSKTSNLFFKDHQK